MREQDRLGSTLAPLFDRLRSTKSATEPQPIGRLSRRELHESICREIGGLLNVRSPLPIDRYGEQPLTVLDYGIPDLTALSPRRSDDLKRLSQMVTRAITTFEPRLTQVATTVVPLDGQAGLLLTCTAQLVDDRVAEPFQLTAIFAGNGDMGQLLNVELPPEL